MNWAEAVREHQALTIGPVILAAVDAVVRSVVRRGYNPRIYAGVATWGDGIEDLVQEVILKSLLEERQLDYMMAVARNSDDFNRLTVRQVKRVLARRRQRTVIDNLLDRCRELLTDSNFIKAGAGSAARYWPRAEEAEAREPTENEVRNAAIAVTMVPRVPYSDAERAPIVYSDANLRTVLTCILKALPGGAAIKDLDGVFHEVLTDWLPGLLTSLEGIEREDSSIGVEDVVLVGEAVNQVISALSSAQRFLLASKLAGISDTELAHREGISRPTLASRKKLVFQIVESAFSELPSRARDAAVADLCAQLAVEVASE